MRWVRRIVIWSIIATLAVGIFGGALVWHDGFRAYAIKTGSMTPTYPTGSLILDRPADGSTPAVGDVVTFRTRAGLVSHRVNALKDGGIETKGDANRTSDVGIVPVADVAGEVFWGTAHLGYVFVFFQQPAGVASLVLLAISIWCAWTAFFPSTEKPAVKAAMRPDDTQQTLAPS
jgi:signal peptidase I